MKTVAWRPHGDGKQRAEAQRFIDRRPFVAQTLGATAGESRWAHAGHVREDRWPPIAPARRRSQRTLGEGEVRRRPAVVETTSQILR
jgi:hypothetical protein